MKRNTLNFKYFFIIKVLNFHYFYVTSLFFFDNQVQIASENSRSYENAPKFLDDIIHE